MSEIIPIGSILLGIAVTLPLIIFAVVRRKQMNKSREDGSTVESQEQAKDSPNDRFFEEIEEGSEVIPFVRTYGPNDKYIIQSILDSRGIPSFLSSQYVNNLLPGIRVKGHTDSTISIDKNDVVAATIFVLEYFDSIVEHEKKENRTLTEAVYNAIAFLHMMPTTGNRYYPELLINVDELVDEIESFLNESV